MRRCLPSTRLTAWAGSRHYHSGSHPAHPSPYHPIRADHSGHYDRYAGYAVSAPCAVYTDGSPQHNDYRRPCTTAGAVVRYNALCPTLALPKYAPHTHSPRVSPPHGSQSGADSKDLNMPPLGLNPRGGSPPLRSPRFHAGSRLQHYGQRSSNRSTL